MSLLTEAEALVSEAQPCSVAKWAAKLPAPVVGELDEAMASPLPLTTIYAALVNRGRLPFSNTTFLRHFGPARNRPRRCACRS